MRGREDQGVGGQQMGRRGQPVDGKQQKLKKDERFCGFRCAGGAAGAQGKARDSQRRRVRWWNICACALRREQGRCARHQMCRSGREGGGAEEEAWEFCRTGKSAHGGARSLCRTLGAIAQCGRGGTLEPASRGSACRRCTAPPAASDGELASFATVHNKQPTSMTSAPGMAAAAFSFSSGLLSMRACSATLIFFFFGASPAAARAPSSDFFGWGWLGLVGAGGDLCGWGQGGRR